jgi:nicotinamide-nucleotide amidase
VIRLRTFGLAESLIGERLAGIEATTALSSAIARRPGGRDQGPARRASTSLAEAAAREAADAIVARLGHDVVYAEGDLALPGLVGARLASRGLTLAVAESCTGGLVGSS